MVNSIIGTEQNLLRVIMILIIFICVFLIVKIIDITIDSVEKWKITYKDRFLDWYWQRRKKSALHRISVNQYKLQNLSDVESDATPEMLALVDRITKDVDFVNSYKVETPTEIDLAEPVTEEDVTLSTVIFNKIDEMIILETENILLPLASTGNNIDVRNYGDYVNDVAEAVHKGLNVGVYKSTTVFTPEYINSYIIKKSSIVVLNTMMGFNKQLPPPV